MVYRSRIKTHIIARHEKKSSFDVKNQPKCINVIVSNYTATVARQQVSLLKLISKVCTILNTVKNTILDRKFGFLASEDKV